MADLDDISVVTEPSTEVLNERQRLDYKATRENCLSWLLVFGIDPSKGRGYAHSTVKNRSHRMDQFYRWVWQQEGGYTVNVTHDHADAWMRELAQEDKSNAHKANCQKSVKMPFKWREHEHGLDPWDPTVTFSDSSGASQPHDHLTRAERKKIPSLIWVCLDAGLRPIEVERAVVSWVDLQNGVLRIPREESSKNVDNWVVGLKDRTAEMLGHWIEEREAYEKYDGTDSL